MESEKKQELVIDGNSFYEIDLKCLKEKKQKQEEAEKRQQKRQRKYPLPFQKISSNCCSRIHFRTKAEEG